MKNPLTPAGIEPATFQFVTQHLNHCDTPVPLLGSTGDKTHIHNNPEYEASAHFMYVRQLLTAYCGIIARKCIIYYSAGFLSGKELALLEMCDQL